MEAGTKSRISETSAVTPWSRKLYRKPDEFWKDSEGLHHAYLVYRALRGDYKEDFKPDAVFYVGKSPAAYLKTVPTNNISEEDVRVWQRFLWNQAVVPMLIVRSRLKVQVYTAYTQPKERESAERIEAILDTTADALELDQLLTAIEAGTIYENRSEAFDRSRAVDRYLLENLNAAANQIAETQEGGLDQGNLEFAHSFLMRLLFVCYLIERGMIKGKHFDDERLRKIQPKSDKHEGYFLWHLFKDLKTYAPRRDALYRIFSRVKERFNGSLFPEKITEEKKRYNEDLIRVVNDFLHCQNLKDKQYMLEFWAYDFRVIPIETISAVYEGFVGEQGRIEEALGRTDSKRSSGAYYTPLHLAELTVDIALQDNEKPVHELKVFDPACGSGVFLVALFGRMAESLRRTKDYTQKGVCIQWARELKPQLAKLYGLDINPTACQITCFSLYLALLEQLAPMDVEYLCDHGEKLPPLLADGPKDSWKTIHRGNLFDSKLEFEEKDFDLVIGNPPWVSSPNQKDKCFLDWIEEEPDIRGPNKQIAHGFMWKASEYLSKSGTACLLLPTTVLFNDHTNKFQREWLKSATVDRVVNFSDLRFILFAGAVHPCIAVRFCPKAAEKESSFRYESPKTDVRSQQGGAVFVCEEDVVVFRARDILKAAEDERAPELWKSHFWGSWRDRRLLSRLADLPKLNDLTGKSQKKRGRWDKSTGIMIGQKTNPGWWNSQTLFLRSRQKFSLAVSKFDCKTVEKADFPLKAEGARSKELFTGPKVLATEGSKNMKVAFCNFTVIFKKSIYVITGAKSDSDHLRFLSAVIKSDVGQYYLFHTSSGWAIEREKVQFNELLSLPFFLPADAPDPERAQRIVDDVANVIRDFEKQVNTTTGWFGHQNKSVQIYRNILEPLVREYYNIDKYEAMLIEDTLTLAAKSFHPKQNQTGIPTLRHVRPKECQTYTQTLCEMLNNFGCGSGFKVNGEVIRGEPYSVVVVSLTDKIRPSVPVSEGGERLDGIFRRMQGLLEEKNRGFVFCKNMKVFDGDDLYVLKPMQMRFWSRTAALNDADEIAGAIINARGGR